MSNSGKTEWVIPDGFMSDIPIVVQHSRMDVTQPNMTLMTTIAY